MTTKLTPKTPKTKTPPPGVATECPDEHKGRHDWRITIKPRGPVVSCHLCRAPMNQAELDVLQAPVLPWHTAKAERALSLLDPRFSNGQRAEMTTWLERFFAHEGLKTMRAFTERGRIPPSER